MLKTVYVCLCMFVREGDFMFCDRYLKLHLDMSNSDMKNKLLIGDSFILTQDKSNGIKPKTSMIFINILATTYFIVCCSMTPT